MSGTRAKCVFSDPVRHIAHRLGSFLADKGLVAEASKYLLADSQYQNQVEHFCGMFHLSSYRGNVTTSAPEPGKVASELVAAPSESALPPQAASAIAALCRTAPVAPKLLLADARSMLLEEFSRMSLYHSDFLDTDFFLRRVPVCLPDGRELTIVAIGTGRAITHEGVLNLNCSVSGYTTANLPDAFFPEEGHKAPEFMEEGNVKRWLWLLKLTPGVHIRVWANLNNGEVARDVYKATFAVTTTGFRLVSVKKSNSMDMPSRIAD